MTCALMFKEVVLLPGVAYVLSLLGQWSLFDAFHWFHSVREKYSSERESVKRQAGAEEKLQQTLALTTKRLGTYQRVGHKCTLRGRVIIFLVFSPGIRSAVLQPELCSHLLQGAPRWGGQVPAVVV